MRSFTTSTGFVEARDAIRIEAGFHAARILNPSGVVNCENVDISIFVEVGIAQVADAVLDVPPMCLFPSQPPIQLILPRDPAFDYTGVFYNGAETDVRVEIGPEGCLFEVAFEDGLEATLETSVPPLLGRAIRDALLIDPGLLGLEPGRACSCDGECNRFTTDPAGPAFPTSEVPRPRCFFPGPVGPGLGECRYQLEPDRVVLRPDGIEFIIAEDTTDVQFATLNSGLSFAGLFLCAANRFTDPVLIGTPMSPPAPVTRSLSLPILVP